jgi:hypothetical protein
MTLLLIDGGSTKFGVTPDGGGITPMSSSRRSKTKEDIMLYGVGLVRHSGGLVKGRKRSRFHDNNIFYVQKALSPPQKKFESSLTA